MFRVQGTASGGSIHQLKEGSSNQAHHLGKLASQHWRD